MQIENETRLASFDVFDTVLIRKCGAPNNIFYILSKVLFPQSESLQIDFLLWRQKAEDIFKSNNQEKDPNIIDIYSSFPFFLKKYYSIEKVIFLEKQIESENLVSNRSLKKIIQKKREEGYTICFISDMYLDSFFLHSLLIREGCAIDDDLVFVSNEHNKRKSVDGKLYTVVRNSYQNIIEWIHYGDNTYSDYQCAKKQGINAIKVDTSFNRVEKSVMKKFEDYTFYRDLTILVSYQRCCRLELGNTVDMANACDIIASLYIPYAQYVVSHAISHGIHTLFFLSRDAYILFELAKLLDTNQSININYLYVSRKSLIQSCYEDISREIILQLLGKESLVGERVDSVLTTLRMPLGIMESLNFDRISCLNEENIFFNILVNNKSSLLKEAELSRKNVIKYLKQENFLDEGNLIGIVDVGWKGTTRFMLNSLKNKYGNSGMLHFYYLGYEGSILSSDKGGYSTYLPMPVDRIGVPYFTELIENYYSAAPHTSTVGYNQKDNGVFPVFEDNPNEDTRTLSEINVGVCKKIVEYINCNSYIDLKNVYQLWGVSFLKLLGNNPQMFNLETFTKVYYFDKKFVKHVPVLNLMRYFFSGTTGLPCIDELSICYTYNCIFKRRYTLYSLYTIVKKINNHLYVLVKKYIQKRKHP